MLLDRVQPLKSCDYICTIKKLAIDDSLSRCLCLNNSFHSNLQFSSKTEFESVIISGSKSSRKLSTKLSRENVIYEKLQYWFCNTSCSCAKTLEL